MTMNELTEDVIEQICAILCIEADRLKINFRPCQQQMTDSCGLMAAAAASALASGANPSNINLDEKLAHTVTFDKLF